MSLLQMSVAGACIIIVTVIVRALAMNRLPTWAFMALWGVAFLRLTIPFSIPLAVNVRIFSEPYTPKSSGVATLLMRGEVPPQTNSIAEARLQVSIWTIVWIVGVFLCALIFLLSYVRCHRIFSASLPVEQPYASQWLRRHPLHRRVHIRQSDQITAPLTYGIVRPVILMPARTDWEDSESLGFVLSHEYIHIRRFDGCVKMLLVLALCIHWFNPLVWVMYILANRDIEISCDKMVVRFAGGTRAKKQYLLTLLNMEEKRSVPAMFANNFSNNAIEERMNAIMSMKKLSITAVLTACLLIIGVTTAFATTLTSAGEIASSDILMSELALERLSKQYPKVGEWVQSQYPDTVWWTYEGYKDWSTDYIAGMSDALGELVGSNSQGDVIITQKMIDKQVAQDAEVLSLLEDGYMLSKAMGGDESVGIGFDPKDIDSASVREFQYAILLKDGKEAVFGPYGTNVEMLAVLEPFCKEQVAAGNLDQSEAEEIILSLKNE